MEKFMMAAGIPVRVNDSQKGTNTITLLHGYMETLAIWDDFAEKLEPYFRVIRIDLPGHGLSGTHPDNNSMDFSSNVIYDVLQKCGVSETLIVGHSLGGYIALAFAVNHPDATRGLVLFHSTPNADNDARRADRDREIALIRGGKMDLLAKTSMQNIFAENNRNRFAEKIAELVEVAEIHEPEGIIASIEGMKTRPDRNEFLKNFHKPLLFIFGESDHYISTEVAKDIETKFPQARVLWLKHSGHGGFIEEPDESAKVLIDFAKTAFQGQ